MNDNRQRSRTKKRKGFFRVEGSRLCDGKLGEKRVWTHATKFIKLLPTIFFFMEKKETIISDASMYCSNDSFCIVNHLRPEKTVVDFILQHRSRAQIWLCSGFFFHQSNCNIFYWNFCVQCSKRELNNRFGSFMSISIIIVILELLFFVETSPVQHLPNDFAELVRYYNTHEY